jgi:ATP-dependent DNA helicase RecQ
MKDQVQALNQAGIHAAYINSSLTEVQITKALTLAAKGQYKIIYVAPERLETYDFMQFVRQVEISMVTVDEAHCISQWGQDFRPSYLKIVQFIKELSKRPIVSAFTATATERVKEDIMCVLGLNNPKVLVTGFDRENLYFGVETPVKKDEYVIEYIREHINDSGIIYCATRKNVDKLYEKLLNCGIPVTSYHAGLTSNERQENQEAFIYDKSPVMVATNAFGMGIDKSNVRYVLHYNMPQSLENYYQEAGRAGRDGEPSECILLYSPQDVVINRFLLDNKELNQEFDADENEAVRQRDEERLQSMINYCLTPNCLRKYILNYFGEFGKGDCGNCSSCLQEYDEWDVTDKMHKIIACVDELRGRYGINVVAGTLSGNDRAKLREYKVSAYDSYASLKELSEIEIKQIIQYLMIENILDVTKDKYALLHTTAKAREVIAQNTPIIMKKSKVSTVGKISKSTRKSDILNSRGLELFDTLRSLRTVIAREESIPPYLVFSDKTLVDMCVKTPLNKEEMLDVSGVGNNKYERYGERFINEINIFTNGHKEKMHFGDINDVQNIDTRQNAEKSQKSEFYITSQQAQDFPYTYRYLVTEIAVQLSNLRDEKTTKKITGADIFRRIQAENYATEQYIDGMRRKVVFEKGKAAGLFIDMRTSHKGTEYEDIYYNEAAQRMIVEMYIKD